MITGSRCRAGAGPEHGQPIPVGEAEVENERVICHQAQMLGGVGDAGHRVAGEPGTRQCLAQQIGKGRLVLDDE